MFEFGSETKSLDINYAKNALLYRGYLQHNLYTSVFSCSLRDKLLAENHTLADLSLNVTNIYLSLPYPYSHPFKWNDSRDPCLEMVHKRIEFNKKLETYQLLYSKDVDKMPITAVKKNKQGFISLPQYIVDLAFDSEKNLHFEGNYDYFYTGGNLTTIEINGNNYLVSSKEKQLVFSNLQTGGNKIMNCCLEPPFCFINCEYGSGNNPYLLVRNHGDFEVLNIGTTKSGKLRTISMCSSTNAKVPYIDVKLINNAQIVRANVAYNVEICEMGTSKPIYSKTFPLENNSIKGDLCQLKTLTDSNVLFLSRNAISILDSRNKPQAETVTKIIRDGFFACNDLCIMCHSLMNQNIVYIASKHSLFKVDLREMQVVKKWAHFLENSPICIKPTVHAHDELVFVASFNETICFHVGEHNHLPFKIDNIANTFQRYKIQRDFLLGNDLENRFALSTSGIEVHGSQLFTRNSVGDVFKQTIHCSKTEDDIETANAMEHLKTFIDGLPKQHKSLEVTHLSNISTFKKVLIAKRKEDDLNPYLLPNKRLKKYEQPMQKFGKYDMATIWEVPTAAAEDDVVEEQKARIDTWLAESAPENFEYDPTVVSI